MTSSETVFHNVFGAALGGFAAGAITGPLGGFLFGSWWWPAPFAQHVVVAMGAWIGLLLLTIMIVQHEYVRRWRDTAKSAVFAFVLMAPVFLAGFVASETPAMVEFGRFFFPGGPDTTLLVRNIIGGTIVCIVLGPVFGLLIGLTVAITRRVSFGVDRRARTAIPNS